MTTPTAAELADRCKQCDNLAEPAAIGIDPDIAVVSALYRCDACSNCWQSTWIDELTS